MCGRLSIFVHECMVGIVIVLTNLILRTTRTLRNSRHKVSRKSGHEKVWSSHLSLQEISEFNNLKKKKK